MTGRPSGWVCPHHDAALHRFAMEGNDLMDHFVDLQATLPRWRLLDEAAYLADDVACSIADLDEILKYLL
jgi:hypothetical protein